LADDANLKEVGGLERDEPILRFFETLQSRRRNGRLAVRLDVEAHERRPRGSTKPSPEG
jgi:hypothetical protein